MRILSLGIERFGALVDLDLSLAGERSSAEFSLEHPPTKRAAGARRASAPPKSAPKPTPPSLFPEQGSGFTLIYGPNEAGKTTLLRAIRFLLLGEDKTSAGKRAPALAGGEAPSMRAIVELSSGSRIDIRRRRGKPNWIGQVLEGGDDVSEDWFMGTIGQPDPSLFRNVFAFSLDELARGREVLERGLLDGLLFGSGLGGTIQPSVILSDLEDAQAKLFKERGQQQPVLQKLARIEQLKSDLRAVSTSSEDLEKLDHSIDEKARDVEAKRDLLNGVRQEEDRLKALSSALEPYAEWQAAKSELEALGDVPDLGPTARVDLERARAVAERVQVERAREASLVPELQASLAAATFDPIWLEAASDVEALDRGIEGFLEVTRQQPELEREREALATRIGRRLAELVPEMTLDALRTLSVSKDQRAALGEAANRLRDLENEARDRDAALTAATSERASLLRDAAALPAATDVRQVARWLDAAPEHGALRERLEALDADAARAARTEEVLRAKLDPPLPGDRGDPALVVLPRGEEIDGFERYLNEHEDELRRLVTELKRTEHELTATHRQIAEIRADGDVPTEGDLDRARERRNAGWVQVKNTLAGIGDANDTMFGSEEPLRSAFERAMLDADEIVDRMRARADAVQRRAQKEATAEHLEADMHRLGAAHARATDARRVAIADWNALWEGAGLLPKSPPAMRAWLGDRARWIDAAEKLREVTLERDSARVRLSAFLEEGKAALYSRNSEPPASSRAPAREPSLVELRAEAERRVTRERTRADAALRIDAALERAVATIAHEGARSREHEDLRKKADAALAEAWQALGIGRGVHASSGPALLDDLILLRETLVEGEHSLRARLDSLRGVADAFGSRLEGVLARVGASRGSRLADVVVADLKKSVVAAQAAARRAEQARERLDRMAREDLARRRALDEAEASLSVLRKRANAKTDAELEAATRRAERAFELSRIIENAERAIARTRGPWELADLMQAAAWASSDALATEVRSLDGRRETENKALEVSLEELATLRSKRSQLDGSARAADLLGDLAAERAALRADVEEFAAVALAKAVLERSIEEFERTHQPALVEEASRLFAEMTGGRYRRVRTTAKKEIFVEHESGALRAPEELSTGTNEQLFFALRLAYVTGYAARTEALPVVLDDVLVNFDRERTTATLQALGTFARSSQVLFFTCHEHLIDLTRATLPGARVITL